MSSIFVELARRLRRTDLLLLRSVRRQRARPAIRAKGQFWGSVITDDEVDSLLRAHGEIDYTETPDGLDDAIQLSDGRLLKGLSTGGQFHGILTVTQKELIMYLDHSWYAN